MTARHRQILPFFFLLAAFLLQWLLLFTLKEPIWDAVAYYAYARSAVFDGDLDFGNDFQLSYPSAGERFAARQLDQVTTITGRVENIFTIGAPLLWIPWLALLRGMALLGAAPGMYSQTMTGYETFFIGNIGLLSALVGFGAFLLSYLVAETVCGRRIALAATLTMMFATPMLYYQFREPLYSHTASALAIALLVFVWWRQVWIAHFGVQQGLILGALIGFAGLVRTQNLIYLALPLLSMTYWWFTLPGVQRKDAWRPLFIYLLFTGAGAFAVMLLQMSVWRVLFGTFFTIPFVQGTGLVSIRAPYLDDLLFSSFRGLLPWMPVFFFSLIGLFVLSRREPRLAWPLLGMLLLALYINGSTRDWFGGGGYGPRRFTSELIILVIGYAAFIQLIPERVRVIGVTLLAAFLTLHQWLLLRYGLAESLGGRVKSMAPTFEWEDEPLWVFLRRLGDFLPRALRNPLDLIVFSGSPLDALLQKQIWPSDHILVLVFTGLFITLLLLLGIRLRSQFDKKRTVVVISGVLVLLWISAQVWILYWS